MKTLTLTLALSALPLSAAWAAGGAHSAMPSMSMQPAMSAMSMQHDMHASMQAPLENLRRLSGREFDRAFLSMMIPHHEGALSMSVAALPKLRDPLVRTWAESIIADQRKEIAEMQSELRRLG